MPEGYTRRSERYIADGTVLETHFYRGSIFNTRETLRVIIPLPERVVWMPVPEWIEGEDYLSRREFVSIARELFAAWYAEVCAELDG